MCLNKITHGRNMPINMVSKIGHNISLIGIRDDGGLLWSTIYLVSICGVIIEMFNILL